MNVEHIDNDMRSVRSIETIVRTWNSIATIWKLQLNIEHWEYEKKINKNWKWDNWTMYSSIEFNRIILLKTQVNGGGMSSNRPKNPITFVTFPFYLRKFEKRNYFLSRWFIGLDTIQPYTRYAKCRHSFALILTHHFHLLSLSIVCKC